MARGRPRKTDTGEVLDSAMKLFWEKGYEATSMNDVSAKSGMAKPGLYAAFGNKDALYKDALNLYFDGFRAALATLETSERPLTEVIRDFLEATACSNSSPQGPRGCFLANTLMETAGQSSELTSVARELNAARDEAFLKRFQRAADNSEVPQADANRLAAFFSAQALTLAALASSGGTHSDLMSLIEVAMSVLPPDLQS